MTAPGVLRLPPRMGVGGYRLVDLPCPAQVRKIDVGCLPMLDAMHGRGIQIDRGQFTQLEGKLRARLAELELDVDALVGREFPGFNAASPDQVADLLYGRLGLQPLGEGKKTGGGKRLSTEDEVLSGMKMLHPVVDVILDHREISKLLSTYVLPIPRLISADGRLRTVFKPTRTRTGRLASGDRKQKKPNLQNIPTRGEWGPQVRNGFVAGPGRVLVSLDLSQIEMRLSAHLSGDLNMCRVFWDNQDIHTQTAIRMFRLVEAEVLWLIAADVAKTLTPTQALALKEFKHTYRLPAKTLGFALLYGVSARGLQLQVLAAGGPYLEEAECQRYIDLWFEAYPEVLRYLQLQHERARRWGMVWTALGRVRLMPECGCVSRKKQGEGDREAGNHPVQGTAADMLKVDMAEIWPVCGYYEAAGEVCWPLLQIHDEIVFEVAKGIAEEFADWGRTIMQTAIQLAVPVDSSADMAEKWGELK